MSDEVITLENEDLEVRVMARQGGRVTQLVNRRDRREWLIGPRTTPSTTPASGGIYTDTPHFGWDEMLPTIDPCTYHNEPYVGVALADHGELWTAQWMVTRRSPTSLCQEVHGRTLAFSFERCLELRGPVLRCEYRCVTPVDTAMLWALHPQFATRDGTSLRLHPEPENVLVTSDGVPRVQNWSGDLIVERDIKPGDDLMIYADPSTTISSASLHDLDGSSLEMTWDASVVRYLGVWADHGRFSRDRVIAIEPTNGFFDELTRAANSGHATLFRANVPEEWWVEIAVEPGRTTAP